MSSVTYENQLLDAIETIVDNKINNAEYNKTIKAVIIKCEDSSIGKYLVRYQDSTFYAYTSTVETIFPEGTLVYVLIPNGDMSQNKVIIDAIEKDLVEYTSVLEGEENYNIINENSITSTDEFGMCSYQSSNKIILYNKNREKEDNLIDIDINSIKSYIDEADAIMVGASFRTNLSNEQKRQGNYGIVFNIDFIDAAGDTITKEYIVDVNQMTGNPYNFPTALKQIGIYDIDSINFKQINEIYIFSQDFPNTNEIITDNDIFVSDINFYAGSNITEEQKEGYSLNIIKPKINYFDEDHTDDIILKAQVKMKGKITTANNAIYYWFKEDNKVTAESDEYQSYGGIGWSCLNPYTTSTVDEQTIRNYSAGTDIISIPQNILTAVTGTFKCVCVLSDNTIVEDTAILYNYSNDKNLSIISDDGFKFTYDCGSPNLIALVNGEDLYNSINYTFQWLLVDGNGYTNILNETIEENEEYNTAVYNYKTLKAKIEAGTAMAAASQEELNSYLATIEKYNSIQRVDRNKIYHLDLTKIYQKGIIKCSIYYNNILIGTTSGIIINDNSQVEGFTLEIENGIQTFLYDAYGTAPTNSSLEKPLTLNPLKIAIYDLNNHKVPDKVLNNLEIEWVVPSLSTLIVCTDEKNKPTLNYNLAEKYNKNYVNNNIRVKVKYQGIELSAMTTFTFDKEGEPGTNGTDMICKIVPNTDEIIGNVICSNLRAPNFTPRDEGKWFRVQLYKSGELLFDDYKNGKATDGNNVVLSWEMNINKYSADVSDSSSIQIDVNNNFSYTGYSSRNANILKCTLFHKNNTYYATYPILTAQIKDSNYDINLTPGTGFLYASYTSDGKSPQWDNISSFEVITQKKINGYKEDISNMDNIDYSWNVRGVLYNGSSHSWENNTNIEPINTNSSTLTTTSNSNYLNLDIQHFASKVYNGMDISNYQKTIDFDAIANSNYSDFVIIRAGYTGYGGDGTSKYIDNSFERFYADAKARGIPVGAYWYSCANTYEKGCAEARFMYENCLKGKQFEYPIYMDIEDSHWQVNNQEGVTSAALGFRDILENLGYYVGIYASDISGFRDKLWLSHLTDIDKWVAKYSSNPPSYVTSYGMWQYTSSGSIDGYDGRLDLDQAYLDYATLIKSRGFNGFTPEEPDPEPIPVPDPDPEPIPEPTPTPEPEPSYPDPTPSDLFNVGDKVVLSGALYEDPNSWEAKESVTNVLTTITRKVANTAHPYNTVGDLGWVNQDSLQSYQEPIHGLTQNRKFFKPKDKYTGECLTNGIEVIVTEDGNEVARIFIPIHLYLNKYGLSGIAAWDGNHVTIDPNSGGSILAPQIGAGKKENDGSFTGIFMGDIRNKGATARYSGLFGYYQGNQTIFLDAETGKSTFGKTDGAQIILDPSNTTAQIKSGDYSTSAGTGMLIDLSKPEIRYGSGDFVVNKNGKLYANNAEIDGKITAESGYIGGWKISDDELDNGAIHLESEGNIYCKAGGRTRWEINRDGSASFGDLDIDSSGNITVDGGTFNNIDVDEGTFQDIVVKGDSTFKGTVSGSDIKSSDITGSTIDISSNGGFLRMGAGSGWTKHPYVSGLNVGSGGVDLDNNDIQDARKIVNTQGATLLCSTADSVKIGNTNSLSSTAPIEVYGSKCYVNQYFEVTTVSHYVRKQNGTRISLSDYINEASSRKIKENIKILDNNFIQDLYNEVNTLNIYSYDYKKEYREEDRLNKYGFMIDDIQDKKMGKLLDIDEGENYSLYSAKGLAKVDLILIKELMKKIDNLERRLEEKCN